MSILNCNFYCDLIILVDFVPVQMLLGCSSQPSAIAARNGLCGETPGRFKDSKAGAIGT